MRASEFVRRIRMHADEQDRHYVMWLGAGCSVSSGIPAAGALVQDQWLPALHRLKTGDDVGLDAWVEGAYPDYDPANAGASYGTVMNARFPLPEDRQRETERLCSKRNPGFGYAVLATLMSRDDGLLSTALTTNFDDMIADAMYVYGDRRPLVIEHDALAGFARPGRVLRPLVVKVHGDHRLNPMHTKSETAELTAGVAQGIRGLLQDRGVIFAGYSGNDVGVIDALRALPDAALPYGVWWVSRSEPTGVIRTWLDARDTTWVQAGSFDELMLLFHQEFELPHPTSEKFERMVSDYRETYESLTDSVRRLPDTDPDSAPLKQAADDADARATDWWGVELAIRPYKDTDPTRAVQMYRDGIERVESADLIGNYANFLYEHDDIDDARVMYERALRVDPEHANNLTNYASLLLRVDGDLQEAARSCLRALDADPHFAPAWADLAGLQLERGKLDLARGNVRMARTWATDDEEHLLLEVGFFELMLNSVQERPEVLVEMHDLLTRGIRSPHWDFIQTLEAVVDGQHSDYPWLEMLALVISGDAPPENLGGWDEWPSPQGD
jgi:tetratricopeptide (TPR) repeat protein